MKGSFRKRADTFFYLDSQEITADGRATDFFSLKSGFVQKIYKNKFGNHEINTFPANQALIPTIKYGKLH
jgi:hypothetical protein